MSEKTYIKIVPQVSKEKIKRTYRRLARELSKKIFVYFQKKEKRPFLEIDITNRYKLNLGREEIKDFPVEMFGRLIKETKKIGFSTLNFKGEPILHPNFAEFIRLTSQEGYQFSLTIRNPFYYQDYWNAIKESKQFCNYFNLILAGINAKTHERVLKEKKGSFEKTTEAIKFFTKNGIAVNVTVYLNKKNWNQFRKIALLCHSLGVRNLRYTTFLKDSEEKKNLLSKRERNFCFRKIKEFAKNKKFIRPRIFIDSLSLIDNQENVCFCRNLKPFKQLFIDYNGGIIFCGRLVQLDGKPNIFEKGISGCLQINISIINEINKERLKDIEEEKRFEGVATCQYCYEVAKKVIPKLNYEN